MPADAGARAKAERWMDWATGTIAAPFRDLFWNLVRLAPEQREVGPRVEAGVVAVVERDLHRIVADGHEVTDLHVALLADRDALLRRMALHLGGRAHDAQHLG